MGGTKGSPPEPEDERAPAPEITVEQFREQFTEEIREFLVEALNSHRLRVVERLMSGGGNNREEAEAQARIELRPGTLALRLIHRLHPQPYSPIGADPECPTPGLARGSQ